MTAKTLERLATNSVDGSLAKTWTNLIHGKNRYFHSRFLLEFTQIFTDSTSALYKLLKCCLILTHKLLCQLATVDNGVLRVINLSIQNSHWHTSHSESLQQKFTEMTDSRLDEVVFHGRFCGKKRPQSWNRELGWRAYSSSEYHTEHRTDTAVLLISCCSRHTRLYTQALIITVLLVSSFTFQ